MTPIDVKPYSKEELAEYAKESKSYADLAKSMGHEKDAYSILIDRFLATIAARDEEIEGLKKIIGRRGARPIAIISEEARCIDLETANATLKSLLKEAEEAIEKYHPVIIAEENKRIVGYCMSEDDIAKLRSITSSAPSLETSLPYGYLGGFMGIEIVKSNLAKSGEPIPFDKNRRPVLDNITALLARIKAAK